MWRCTGLRWQDGGPGWTWSHPRLGERRSPVRLGDPLALAVRPGSVRRCVGVRSSGGRTPCPRATELRPEALRDQCDDCAALDRSSSVAADTKADDPREYAVYLAYFAPGVCKVGITAAERGAVRLLEQAAVCFTFLGRGPLMAARRTESVLGSALGIPDRVGTAVKRGARVALPPREVRMAELRAVHDAATTVIAAPGTLAGLPFAPVDHAALFGLEPDAPRPVAYIGALAPGAVVTGTVRAAAGSDLYLNTGAGQLLLDARLASGWPLTKADPALPTTAPVRPALRPTGTAEPLF